MKPVLTQLDICLINSCLFSKTDEEIAEKLEMNPDDIRPTIIKLAGGENERSEQLEKIRSDRMKLQMEKMQKKLKKPARKKEKPAPEKPVFNDDAYREKRRREVAQLASRRVFESRKIDYSKMRTLVIDDKTTIWIPKNSTEADIKMFIERYRRTPIMQQKFK